MLARGCIRHIYVRRYAQEATYFYNNNQDEIPPVIKPQLVDVDGDGIITFVDLNASANAAFVFDHNSNGRIDSDDLLRPIDINNFHNGGWQDGVDGVVGNQATQNGFIDDVNGWNFVNDNNNANPVSTSDNHGTAVAGIAAAIGNNGVGVSGAAQNVRILPIRIAQDPGDGSGFISFDKIAKAVYYAAGAVIDVNNNVIGRWRGADVLVNSWSGGTNNVALNAAFNWAATHGRNEKGMASFNAAGNSAAGTTAGLSYNSLNLTGVPAGNWIFEWRYTKNATNAAGEDSTWIANVRFPNGGFWRYWP